MACSWGSTRSPYRAFLIRLLVLMESEREGLRQVRGCAGVEHPNVHPA